MTIIVKNREQALEAAKAQALSTFDFYAKDTKDSDWLIKNTSTKCDCGETQAVSVIYFDADGNQHEGFAGYCESCGEDY